MPCFWPTMVEGKFTSKYIFWDSLVYDWKGCFMKVVFLFVLFFVTKPIIADDSKLKICLTGSTEKTIPNYGEAFVNGARLALKKYSKAGDKVEVVTYYYDVTPLAAVEALSNMKKEGCDAIIGFSTGNDLLAIEKDLSKDPILTISIYGDPQPQFNKTNYLRTLQPSSDELLKHLLQKLPKKIKDEDRILVVTAIDRTEMIEYKKSFERLMKKTSSKIEHVSVMEQTQDLTNLNRHIKSDSKWDYVFLFTRSLIAAKVTDIISDKRPINNPVFIGTKYFGSDELPAYFNFLKNKNIEAYFSRQNCFCDKSEDLQKFNIEYKSSFNKTPMLISVETYDVTRFILQSVGGLTTYNPQSLIKFFNNWNVPFTGIGSMNIGKNLEIQTAKKFLIKVSNKGYEGIL